MKQLCNNLKGMLEYVFDSPSENVTFNDKNKKNSFLCTVTIK